MCSATNILCCLLVNNFIWVFHCFVSSILVQIHTTSGIVDLLMFLICFIHLYSTRFLLPPQSYNAEEDAVITGLFTLSCQLSSWQHEELV